MRGDIADYYFEVQRFDKLVGDAMAALEEIGELDNTIIAMTGDHGMPFPRCKSNLYDSGTRVALAIRGPVVKDAGRDTEEFTSLCDLAPTFLEAAGVKVPKDMTGRSLLPILKDQKRDASLRDHILVGKERHVPSQEKPDMGGYPGRGIRTHDFFYIRNFKPDRWPNGTPDYNKAAIPGNWLADTDNGPTKTYIVDNKDKDALHQKMYDLSFAKRPGEELFDLSKDPDQLNNVADDPAYAEVKKQLSAQLMAELKESGDPRIVGGVDFDAFPYLGGGPKHPTWRKK